MPLRILIAGCPDDERARLESLVKAVIGRRAETGSWCVSLVGVGGRFSTQLDGPHPGLKGVSFVAGESQLRDAILGALRKAGLAGEAGPSEAPVETPVAAGSRRDAHACDACGKPFVVLYQAVEGESSRDVPVACPHCWHRNQVAVGQWAAAGQEYQAEKA